MLSLTAVVFCLASVIPVDAADGVRQIMQSQADMSEPIVITQPGSYRLISNIVAPGNAIEIAASNVTLDLNWFSIQAGGWG
jgi:hypothetical protein